MITKLQVLSDRHARIINARNNEIVVSQTLVLYAIVDAIMSMMEHNANYKFAMILKNTFSVKLKGLDNLISGVSLDTDLKYKEIREFLINDTSATVEDIVIQIATTDFYSNDSRITRYIETRYGLKLAKTFINTAK